MSKEILLLVEKCSHCFSYYDIDSGTRLHSVQLPDFPHEFVVDAAQRYAYIGHYGVETSGHLGAGGTSIFQIDIAARKLARTIDIAKTAVDGSVTIAGQHVVLNSDSTANCFYAIGETVALRGSTTSAALAGDTVTIDGTVDGDVEVWADKLILGKNARITGTVNAHVSEDPRWASLRHC